MTVTETAGALEVPANQPVVRQSATADATCRGTTKSGDPCRSRILLADGYCHVHSPTAPADPVALGRVGGLKSGEVRREQAKSVRDRLRDKVEQEFSEIAAAFDAGLQSDDERVRVATAQALLAESYGRPPQAIVGDVDKPLAFRLVSLLEMAREGTEH